MAGKGDTYRKVNQERYARNYAEAFGMKQEYYAIWDSEKKEYWCRPHKRKYLFGSKSAAKNAWQAEAAWFDYQGDRSWHYPKLKDAPRFEIVKLTVLVTGKHDIRVEVSE